VQGCRFDWINESLSSEKQVHFVLFIDLDTKSKNLHYFLVKLTEDISFINHTVCHVPSGKYYSSVGNSSVKNMNKRPLRVEAVTCTVLWGDCKYTVHKIHCKLMPHCWKNVVISHQQSSCDHMFTGTFWLDFRIWT
jgi:hypothetical protein